MPDKKLYQMESKASGNEVYSVMFYMMKYYPHHITALYHVYEDNDNMLSAWFTGAGYALALVEDNGIPLDLDEVLHGWDGDRPFDIGEAVREWIAGNGRG